MSDQKDNQALEEYLKGDSPLSRRYRNESEVEPPAHLDAAILSAAKKAIENQEASAGSSTSRWYVPLSLAAVVVISFSVIFKIYDQDGQQIFSKQSETKTEKPAMMMDDMMEYDIGEPPEIMRDESFLNEGVRIESESGSRSSPAVREDISPDASVLSKETGPSETQAPASVPVPAERRVMRSLKSLPSADISGTTSTLTPEHWFEIINQLWFDGDEDGAYRELKNFLEAYQDYAVEQLKDKLPQGMDLSAITADESK